MTRSISGLSEIAGRYDAVICDVWGVIHNGVQAFPSAHEALTEFARTRGPVVLLSNAPRPASAVIPQLEALKVPQSAWQGFITSGDATRVFLRERAPGPAWVVGPERDRPLFQDLELQRAGPEAAAFIVCTGLVDDEVETPADYRPALQVAAQRGIEMICANPDRVVQRGEKLVYCAGALADIYAELGGPVIMAGKPYGTVYDLALAEAARLAGKTLSPDRVLCIGDAMPTDIQGANNQGLDCLFVVAGIHVEEAAGDPAGLLARHGLTAAYSVDELVW